MTSRTSTTTPHEPTDKDLEPDYYGTGLLFMQMQNYVIPVEKNQYQLCENLIGDTFGRYMAPTNDGWKQNHATFNASLAWLNSAFNNVLPNIYSAWFKLRALTGGKGEQFAWAQLLRIAAMHRMTDKYGPIPTPKSPETRSPWPTIRRINSTNGFSTIWTT